MLRETQSKPESKNSFVSAAVWQFSHLAIYPSSGVCRSRRIYLKSVLDKLLVPSWSRGSNSDNFILRAESASREELMGLVLDKPLVLSLSKDSNSKDGSRQARTVKMVLDKLEQ